jgi:4-hydroxy-tetrahydrodipicolinate synthase
VTVTPPSSRSGAAPDLTGVWVTTVTPFDAAGELDLDTLAAHTRFLAEQGVTKLVPLGNTGESFSLDADESVEIVRVMRAAAPDALVVAGVGGELRAARALTAACLAAGADGIMVHHPSQTYVGGRGLERYYRALLDEAEGRALLYKRGPQVPDELLVRLLGDGHAWGVKYAVNDLVAFAHVLRAVPHGTWLCGTAELWAPFFALLGSPGFTSGLGNAAPALPLAMDAALRAGDFRRAAELQALAAPFEELRAEDLAAKNVPAVRAALGHAGFDVGAPRAPLAPLEDADLRRVETIWSAWRDAALIPVQRAAGAAR